MSAERPGPNSDGATWANSMHAGRRAGKRNSMAMRIEDMQHVVALDPGGRSGWASAWMSEDYLQLTGSGVLEQRLMARWLAEQQLVEHVGRANKTRMVGKASMLPRFEVVVNESWKPRRIHGSMDWIEGDPLLSAQHVGQIRFIADLSGAQYIEQPPSDKDRFRANFPNKLLSLDEYSKELHDQDARLHLWGYFFDNWFTTSVDPDDCVVLP